MGDYVSRILERAEHDPLGAAMELGRGLMRGDRANFKLGYDHRSAALAAQDLVVLSARQAEQVEAHLHGYALGMNEDREQIYPAPTFDPREDRR